MWEMKGKIKHQDSDQLSLRLEGDLPKFVWECAHKKVLHGSRIFHSNDSQLRKLMKSILPNTDI